MPPTPTTTDPRLTRALGFERGMHAAVGRVVTTVWGHAFLDPALARCYERNAAWALADAGGGDAQALDRDVERLFSATGLGHRRMSPAPPALQRLGGPPCGMGRRPARPRPPATARGPAPPPPP